MQLRKATKMFTGPDVAPHTGYIVEALMGKEWMPVGDGEDIRKFRTAKERDTWLAEVLAHDSSMVLAG